MKMKVAEYIAEFFAGKGICDCFMITGGGAMHLNEAFGHNEKINCIFNHHEQASAIAAESYARMKGMPAVVCVTSGPGGTNALTGVMGAWVDSIPMFVISGQVKRETTVRACEELKLRQLGDQEHDISKTAAHMAKYAVMLKDPEYTAFELEKAYWLATTGRKGPVWIDVPLDVQSAVIDRDDLMHFDEAAKECFIAKQNFDDTDNAPDVSLFTEAELKAAYEIKPVPDGIIKMIIDKIAAAKAPAILAGTGIHLANDDTKSDAECVEDILLKLIKKFKIPVLTAWNANDLIAFDDPYYAGMPGTVGTRYGNFVLQNCDLLINLGCRMNIRMTGYEHYDFAKNAQIISVDIDGRELSKPTVNIKVPVHADLKDFMPKLLEAEYKPSDEQIKSHEKWLSWCKGLIEKYPVVLPEYHNNTAACECNEDEASDKKAGSYPQDNINPYVFIDNLFDSLSSDDKIICGNGSACVITFQAAKIKQGQRMYTNSGCATMGYGLPAAIGAAFAVRGPDAICAEKKDASTVKDNQKNRIICIDGDGSIMMNIQELATVSHHKLDIKIFLINNRGYHSMRQTQRNLFDGNYIGVGPDSGLSFPDFEKLSAAFGIDYSCIKCEKDCDEVILSALESEGPVLIEVIVDPSQDFEPKISSRINEDGSITSATLSDMAPFLDRGEYEQIKYEK